MAAAAQPLGSSRVDFPRLAANHSKVLSYIIGVVSAGGKAESFPLTTDLATQGTEFIAEAFAAIDLLGRLSWLEFAKPDHHLLRLAANPHLLAMLVQVAWSTFFPDPRLGVYSRALSFLLLLLQLFRNPQFDPNAPPVVPLAIDLREEVEPLVQLSPETVPCGHAGTLVQASHIAGGGGAFFRAYGEVMHSGLVPRHASPGGQGDWLPGEDPIQVIQWGLGPFAWPAFRNISPWGSERMGVGGAGWAPGEQPAEAYSAYRYSDAALEALVFEGCGQHRVVKVDRTRPGPAGEDAPAGAYYAVPLGWAAAAEVEEGFARLGADGYFDERGRVVAIVRGGRVYTPGGPLGTGRSCTTSHRFLGDRHLCSAWSDGWLHAKLAFRGTLFAVVTAVDHLQGTHLTWGNSLSLSSLEVLPTAHPLRRLLSPFVHATAAVNYNAAVMLLAEESLLPRATALTRDGFRAVFAAGNASDALAFATVPEARRARGVDTLALPYDEDGAEYYAILRRFVERYIGAEVRCDDPLVAAWYSRLASLLPRGDLPPLSCGSLADVIATFAHHVSALHGHVGQVAGEVEDPCFAPFAWREGELCGTPRQSLARASIMAATGNANPRIVDDYTFLFEAEEAKGMWRTLTAELLAFGEGVDARNEARERAGRRAYRVFEPRNIETSVAV